MKKALLVITCILLMSNGFAQKKNHDNEVTVIKCIDFHVTRPLQDLVKEFPVDESKLKKGESEDRFNRHPQKFRKTEEKDGPAYGNDPASIQREMGTTPGRAPIANWAGQTASGFRPFDPSGAVSTTNYIQMINSTTFKVYNKTTGAVTLTATFGTLWAPATPNDGDPIVLYDKAADRWFLSQFGQTGNKMYIAISATNDPLGSWYTYTYTSPQFPDYLKFSVWQDGYYMTSNQTQRVFAFERTAMLAGSAGARALSVTFSPPQGTGFFVPLPGDASDGTLPPTGTPCPIFSYSDNGWGAGFSDAINIYQMAVNWVPTTPTGTITLAANVPTAAFNGQYNASWNDVSQPGTTQKLDGIGGCLMFRAQWKPWNTGGYNTVVLSWGVYVSATQRSIKWCELRQNQTTHAWTMYQEGIYSPTNDYRWMSSITMDNNGGIAMAYLKSNATNIYPSLCYTGRMSCDPLGTMPITEIVAKAGTGSQTGVNRDGDYAQTVLDPDGITFWHTGEYMGTGGNAGTQIFSFQLPTCGNTASVVISETTGTNPECAGALATFTAVPTNGGSLPVYQWQVNGANVGTNSPTYTTTTLTNGQIVTCIMTSNLAGVLGSPATSNAITMVVNPIVTPTVAIALTTGTNPQCAGASVTFTATPTNGGTTPAYQWQVNGVNAGTNAATFTTTTLTTGQIVTCIMTSNAPCATVTTATSNSITMTVNPSVVPSVVIAITSGTNPTCTGASVTFTATPTNGGTPSYQWKVNGVNTGTNSATFTTTTLTNGQIVTCVMTSTAVCAVPATATSNTITMTVTASVAPTVAIALTTGSNPMCVGASATFTATPTNGGTIPAYQWKVNGVNAGTNSPTFTTSTLTNGQIVTCVMTSNLACANPVTATSNAITIVVAASFTPSVSIALTAGTNPICSGIAATFTATPTNGGTPSYQWLVNGVNAGTNSATFTTTTLTNGQIVTCVMTSSLSCANPLTATSNAITMTVNPSVTPTITIAITNGTNPKCTGASTTYTATITNGGTATYQWKRNGANVGTNSAVYTTTNNTNNAVITCILTSTAPCASPNPVTSNSITMVVANTLVPSVTIAQTAGTNPECAGASATFTATPTNGGMTPTYQWKVNGVNAGTNSPTFTTTTLTNGQIVTCVITSSLTCANPTTATSNGITMVINASLTPAVAIALTSGTNPECAGASATFTATATNGGTPTYQWQVNGVNAGTNSSTFTTTTLTNGQIVTCIMTSSITCATNPTATSNAITMVVSTSVTPAVAIALTTGTNPMCAGASATFTATAANGGTTPAFQWLVNGANAGTNSATFTTTTLTNGQIVTCVMTTSAACPSSATATSNAITMVVNPSPAAPVAGSNSAICQGATLLLNTATVANATYAWSGPLGFTSNLQNPNLPNATTGMAGTYSLFETVAGCTSPLGAVIVVINPIPAITNSTFTQSICSGGTAIIVPTSSVANSTFAWNASTSGSITGFAASGTGNISDVLINTGASSGTVIYIITPTGPVSTLCQGAPTTFTVTVNPLPTVSVSANPSTFCSGQTTTLTASGATTYTWSAGATSTGVTTATASPAATTTYTVTGTDAGCSNTATSTVTVTAAPPVVVNSTSICEGQTVVLIANGATTYTWSAGATPTGVNTATVNPTLTTTYTVTGTSGGCSATAVSTITVTPLPIINVNSASICEGQTATLVANGGTTYFWSTGATSTGVNTATASPLVTTSYTVSGTTAGCTGSAVSTVTVTAIPPTPTITQNGNTLTSSSATGNQWYLNGLVISGATGQTYTATQSGNYSVIVSDNGCYSLSSADVPVVVTGIEEATLASFIDIYPNPNHGIFTVSSTKYKVQSIKIVDVLGQEIRNYELGIRNEKSTTIDLSIQASGIYFVEIITNSGLVVKKVNVIK